MHESRNKFFYIERARAKGVIYDKHKYTGKSRNVCMIEFNEEHDSNRWLAGIECGVFFKYNRKH